ncbi:MAG: glycoside hydrolase family 3 N-terminal domain-containing protein [Eubacteriales bacterium]|nr:glycoside hydrolase family 3 N-terminal domain-containing protein [Eubacteriales bacterium]
MEPLFPFGYGLSYTAFGISGEEVSVNGTAVSVTVQVQNTGDVPGKETVQLYVSAPEGRLPQPYQSLVAFEKTKELGPGETCGITMTFDAAAMASYDETKSAYLLEPGTYLLRVGNSSRNTRVAGAIEIPEEIATRKVKSCLGRPDFQDYVPEKRRERPAPDSASGIVIPAEAFDREEAEYKAAYEIDPEVRGLSDEELLHLAIGYFDPKGGLTGMIGNAGSLVAGSAGETAHIAGSRPLIMADGPAGLRIAKNYFEDDKGVHSMAPPMPESMMPFAPGIVKLFLKLGTKKPKNPEAIREQYCTAIPIGTAIAQSWNTEFAEICGDIVGTEMEIFHIDLWLAPALNIHRSIRCGRNFEYYSEDPLISGKMAAHITKGVQRHPGKDVTIKHFAANNQEYNRTFNNSLVSERAMREIYLKGFELCVKEARPAAVMTSYNLINGQHASTRRDLIEDILRSEFGFDGIVMTDWVINGGMVPKDAKYPGPKPAEVAAAGGDLFMPGSKKDYESLEADYRKGTVTKQQLQINAGRILRASRRAEQSGQTMLHG